MTARARRRCSTGGSPRRRSWASGCRTAAVEYTLGWRLNRRGGSGALELGSRGPGARRQAPTTTSRPSTASEPYHRDAGAGPRAVERQPRVHARLAAEPSGRFRRAGAPARGDPARGGRRQRQRPARARRRTARHGAVVNGSERHMAAGGGTGDSTTAEAPSPEAVVAAARCTGKPLREIAVDLYGRGQADADRHAGSRLRSKLRLLQRRAVDAGPSGGPNRAASIRSALGVGRPVGGSANPNPPRRYADTRRLHAWPVSWLHFDDIGVNYLKIMTSID